MSDAQKHFIDGMTIVTVFDNPPSPFEAPYVAYLDGDEESGRYGRGDSRGEAIEDLRWFIEDDRLKREAANV